MKGVEWNCSAKTATCNGRMLKLASGFVVRSKQSSRYPKGYACRFPLRPCLGQGASRRARVGRVRSLAILNSLRVLCIHWFLLPPRQYPHNVGKGEQHGFVRSCGGFAERVHARSG
jgi:hypothetical protein